MGYVTENNVFVGFKSFLMGCKSISYIERSLFFHGHATAYVELPINAPGWTAQNVMRFYLHRAAVRTMVR